MDNLTLLIASRGRPTELLRTITETDALIADPGRTVISVALDLDDASMTGIEPPDTRSRLVWSLSNREDSLGAKYNRAAEHAPAEIYVLGADDNVLKTEGWDLRIRETMSHFGDGLGFVYFGRLDGTLPTNMAVPHKLKEFQAGMLFPPYWPVWFHDTWVDEIAHMCGRILWTDITVDEIGGRGMSRGVRDVAFWAALFDALRVLRFQIAGKLSEAHNPHWLQMQLGQRHDILTMFFGSRMARLRDPYQAHQFEKRLSFDAPEDERYQRIKNQAQHMLAELQGQRAA